MSQVFTYIAENNTSEAQGLCANMGYETNSHEEIADALESIAVNSNGSEGLKEVLSIHPEKDVIIELFSTNKRKNVFGADGSGECSDCKLNSMFVRTMQANGNTSTSNTTTPHKDNSVLLQTNTLLVVGIVVLVGAAVYLKN